MCYFEELWMSHSHFHMTHSFVRRSNRRTV